MKIQQLRQLIREELQNTFKKPSKEDAQEFVTQVLKMGSTKNLFDIFMKKNKIDPNELSTFVDMVADEIKNY